MQDIKQALRDFVATANSGKYTDEKILLSKFPELEGYDVEALRDFVATSNSGKYTNEDELFSKFPEFNISGAQASLKKKEPTTTESSLAGTSSGLSSEQNLNPFAKNTVGITQPAPTKTVAAQGVTKPMAVATSVPAIDVTEKAPTIPAIDVETQKLINDENNISTIAEDDGWYSDNLKMVSFLADKIQYLNPTAAAVFPVTTKGAVKFLDNSFRAIEQGQKAGSIVAPATTMDALGKNTSSETIQKYIKATKDVERFGPSKDMQGFSKVYQEEGESFFGVIKGLAENPQALPELIISSMSTMANLPTLAAGATTVGAGALAGGGIPGALASVPVAMGTMSAVLENGLTFGELMQEELTKRNLPFTEESVRKVLEDEKTLSSMRIKAASRGAIIGVFDALTGKLAGKVGAKLLGNTAASKIKSGAAAVGIESLGGSGGEATARAAIGQKMDAAEIVLEGISEAPMAIPSIYSEVLKRPTFKVNGEVVTEQTVKDIVENGSGAELATIKFDIKNDNVGYNKIIQDKVVTNSIKEDVRKANPNLNETSLNAITELEKQLQDLEGNKTQTGKDKAAALRQQIKNIQENQLQEEVKAEVVKDETIKTKEDAIQKPSTNESLLRGEQPEVGLQEVGEGNAQPEGVTAGTTEVVNAQPQEEVTIGEYNPSEEVKDKDMNVLLDVLSKNKVEPVAEPDITDFGDNVVFEYLDPSQGDGVFTRLTFNKNENGEIVGESVKIEKGVPRIKETKFFQNFVESQTQAIPEVSSKTPEQEVTELKGLFGKKEATTDSGISVSDKATVNNIKTKLADKAKAKIIESAQRGLTTLKSVLPDFDIVIHDNEGSYNAAMKTLNGTQSSKGNFAYNQKPDGSYSGRIDINLDRADGRTVAHEIFHGVMLQAFGENPKLFKAFKDRISKVLKDSTNKQLVEFANLYEGDVTYEEYLAELGGILEQQEDNISPSTLQKIAAIINEFVAKITNGALKPFEDIKNTKDIVDFFNTISESIRKGEEIDTALFQAMQEGASISIGEPSTISRSQKGEKVKFSKTPFPLSFVTEADKIDINKLIDDIIAKNQKVWFWMADQLGRGNYYDAVIKGDHYLDAGPSFALDPVNRSKGILWASGLSEKTLSDQIAKADYIFFISGSAEKAKLFNKRVLDLVAERINKKSNFKKFKNAINSFKKETVELKTIKNALANVNSFEELANSTKRKEFLISINEIGNLKTAPEGSLKELLNSFDAFVDYNELRDGFYRENNFTQNDIMLIGKPTKVGGKAPHSTYENAILGEVVGVPDTKIDSWNIMPQDVKDAYTKGNKFIDSKTGKEKVRGELSIAQKAKVIAAETGVVRELKSKSQIDNRKKAIAVANTMGMNDKGFFKKDSNPSQLNNMLRQYGYSVKQARETADGFGGGYYLVDEEGNKAIKTPISKAQKVQEEVEQMQQSIPVPISKAQKGLINLTENDVLKYKRVGIDDKRTAQAMNQIGLSGVKFTKEEVDKKIKEEFNKLMKDADSYVMNEDSPAVTEAIKFDIATLKEDGASLAAIERYKSALDENSPYRVQVIEKFSDAQKQILNQWKNYLSQSNYSDGFKYIILDAVLTHNYDSNIKEYKKRNNKTIRNFTPFDAGTLASIYNSDSKNLLKDYVEVQEKNITNIVNANFMVSTKEGKWLKFNGGESEQSLTQEANKLSQLVQNTYWCTKTNALSQLRGGDFYVFVTEDGQKKFSPRIAIRMDGNRVGEVRGNASSAQDLEPNMLPVADKFLKENIPNDSGKKWLDSIAYNTKVKDFTKKIEDNKISKDDIFEYLDIIKDAGKYSVDRGENGLVTTLKQVFNEKIDQDEVSEDLYGKIERRSDYVNENTEFFYGNLDFQYLDLEKIKNLKYITGNADFENSKIEDLGKLEYIGGNVNFEYSEVKDLGNLKNIGGYVDFGISEIESLGNLESIGSDVDFSFSKIESLGNLKSIGGSVSFLNTKIDDLGKLENIGGTITFGDSKIEDLGNLKTIGGSINFDNSQIKSLGKLKSIGRNVDFSYTNVEDLGDLESIGGDVNFEDSKIKSLGNLKSIGDDVIFSNSKVEDLGKLEYIGGFAKFSYSNIKYLGVLKSINGNVYFENSQIKDLGNLETINGFAFFGGSNVESLGKLKYIGLDARFEKSKIKDLGNLEYIGGVADFENSIVENLGALKTINSVAIFRNSIIENLGNLKNIFGSAEFSYSNVKDLGNLESIGGRANFQNSKIKSLGNLKSIGRGAEFSYSIIEDLGNLKSIGGNATFENSKIEDLGNLESIGGNATFENSIVKNLGALKSIDSAVVFTNSKVESLGNLEAIGGFADFSDSIVKDLGALRSINGNAYFSNSKIKDLKNLKYIDGEIDFRNSEIKDLGRLNFIGGVVYSDNPTLNEQALDIRLKSSPTLSKAQLTDPITKVVREARAQGFSEEAIKLFLEGEGISASEIESAMAPETPASARVKISEQLTEGFDRMMGEVEGIIEKSKNRNVDQAKITENVLNYVMGSKVYENATDVQREKIIRDIKTKFGIRLKSAPKVERLLGTIKDIKKFTLTEKQLYIKRLKDLQEGAKTAVAAWKQASELMSKEIKGLVKSGTITSRQAGFIISKFSKVNMLSPTSMSRFVDYMGKVFADAEYGAQLGTAKSLRGDIKKLSKNKDKNADFRKLAQEFVNIDPSMVDDIYAYNKMASEIKSSVKGSTLRGQKVNFSDIVSIQDAARYIRDTLMVQDKKILEEQRAEAQELMGIDASEMTPEQLKDLLEGDGEVKVTKYNESIVRGLLDKAFKAYSGVINEILKTGYDAFYTGEKVELTKNQKTLIKQFMDMDLSVLTPKESLEAVDALANFIQNQSTAKMQSVVSDYTGRLNARKLADKGTVAQPLMKYKSKGFGKFLAEQTTTLPILFEKMFKGFNRSGKVMDMMGVTKLINGKSLAQNQSNMIVNDYVRQFFNKKANGEAFNTESNNVERGMASFMMRNVIGTEQEMKDEFNRRKNLLEESIEVLSKGNDLEQQKAALYQKAYDKILKDSKTIQEVKSKTDATNLEAIEFWTNQWADKYEELSDVSENVYNKILDKDINYTPDRFARISSDTGEVDLANDESAFHNNNGTIYKKETGVLMKATKPETLPTNKKNGKPTSYIELSFDKNNSNSMYDALVDMKTASAIRQIEAFENSADFEKIVPTADDAKILKDRVQLYVRNIRNKSPYSDDQFSKAVRNLNRLAAFGVGQALSGFGQPIKQMVPVLTNTLINAGSIDIMSGFNAAKQKFMSESGYGIANRGVESQAQIESLNKLIDSAPTGNFDKTIKAIEKINQKYLEFFLVNPDVFIARASWMSYYEKSLKKQGIDPNGVDYNTHELNEEAANYAQRMVDRQQNISDVDLSGKLFASKESANQVLVKMLMPFASFRMNQSARLGADLATLADKTATAEDKTIAKKSLAGFGVELATFKIISAGIAITLGTLTKALMGQDEDEEEKDKRINNVIKGQWTGTITDIISPLPVVDKPIQAAVETVSTLLEEGTGLPLSTFGVSKSDWTSNLGTFGISAQRATELYDMTKLATTGKYTDDFNKEHTISEESQSQITKLLPFAMLSNMGLAPSEVNTVVKNAVKYAKKNTKSPEEKQQAKENKEERESTKQEKISALETIIEESNDEAIINQAKDKIDELDADKEEKKIIKQENAEEKQAKKKLLVDPNTGEEYDTETDLKRYNRDLWEQNFGEGSDWYESHKEEKEMESLLRKKVQQMKDEEMNYTGRNSDGSRKRFGASATKKTQRFGSSSKGKVKRFGS